MKDSPLNDSVSLSPKVEKSLASTIALELIKEAGYVQKSIDEDGLALRSGRSLLVLVPRERLSQAEAQSDLEHWYAKLKSKGLPGISAINLIYCLAGPQPHLKDIRKRRKAAFVGNFSVHLDYIDEREVPRTLGSLDRSLTAAISRGRDNFVEGRVAGPEDLRGVLEKSIVTHNEFASRLGAVTPIGTYAIFAVCLLLFGWGTLVGGTTDMFTLLRFGANYPPLTIGEHEWWRLYASTFLHIGFIHLLCNMIALLTVALRFEQVYGTRKYLALYSIAGFCGSMASALTGQSVAAGASGALFGVFGAIVVLGRRFHTEWPAAYRRSMFQGMLPMIAYNLIYGFSKTGIDNAAHLGGLVAGCLFALAVRPQALQQTVPHPVTRQAMLAIGLLPFFSLFWVVGSVSATQNDFAGFPQKQYSDASGDLMVRLPAFFVPKSKGEESYLSGPRMVVQLMKLDDVRAVVIDNPLFIQGLQQVPGTASITTEVHNGRTWVLRNGTEGEVPVRQGFVYFGMMPVKVEVAVANAEGARGDQLRLMAMETLERTSYDRKANGQALAEQGLHARALEELATVEDSLEVSLLRVDSLEALARYTEAEQILNQIGAKNPKNPQIARARWHLFDEMRDDSRALVAVIEAEHLETDPVEKNHLLAHEANHLSRLGRTQESVALFKKVRKADQKEKRLESEILGFAAWNAVLDGHYKEALPLVERSIKADENNANLDTRGRAYLELGEYQKAKVDFEKIFNTDVNKPYANYAIARILQQEGNAEGSRNFYFRYLALAGENGEFAKDALKRAKQLGPQDPGRGP